jgi:hypothetical protein
VKSPTTDSLLIGPGAFIMTLNCGGALERALDTAGKWDIGTACGVEAFPGREPSPGMLHKLHESVSGFGLDPRYWCFSAI